MSTLSPKFSFFPLAPSLADVMGEEEEAVAAGAADGSDDDD